jgi:CRISPR-associated protein Cmr2
MSKTYLALTIGPIHRTIQRAVKTRELWTASFLLSQFMRQLLVGLKPFGAALSPDLSELETGKKHHGAGIWNDNCFFEIHDGQVENLKAKLPQIIADAKNEIIRLALHELNLDKKQDALPLSETRLREILAQHFHCHATLLERDPTETKPILKQLGELLASAEMLDLFPATDDDFVSRAMFRGRAVRHLYNEGYDFKVDDDKIFTPVHHFDLKRRLPSLLEIAVREFRGQPVFKAVVGKINDKINEKNGDDETDEENLAILNLLKSQKDAARNSLFKKRHKYVAIVQCDGDDVGRLISEKEDEGEIKAVSAKLMAFSTEAVGKIVDYDGLPVYAGGDDLLFIAPLQNSKKVGGRNENIFDLLETIQDVFIAQNLPNTTSLSFGLSIFYYKYPVGEAHENARELLKRLAKKLEFNDAAAVRQKKKALAFRVMLHGGQSFAAALRQDGPTWKIWKDLLKAPGGEDMAFTSGVVHNLERLEWLLDDACANGGTEAFFDHHFNEAKGTERWKFIEKIRELAEAIHDEYAELFPPGCDITEPARQNFFRGQLDLPEDFVFADTPEIHAQLRTKFCNNLLYSALRMIQFLNADDHE